MAIRADPLDRESNGSWKNSLEPKNLKVGASSGRARFSAEAFYVFQEEVLKKQADLMRNKKKGGYVGKSGEEQRKEERGIWGRMEGLFAPDVHQTGRTEKGLVHSYYFYCML